MTSLMRKQESKPTTKIHTLTRRKMKLRAKLKHMFPLRMITTGKWQWIEENRIHSKQHIYERKEKKWENNRNTHSHIDIMLNITIFGNINDIDVVIRFQYADRFNGSRTRTQLVFGRFSNGIGKKRIFFSVSLICSFMWKLCSSFKENEKEKKNHLILFCVMGIRKDALVIKYKYWTKKIYILGFDLTEQIIGYYYCFMLEPFTSFAPLFSFLLGFFSCCCCSSFDCLEAISKCYLCFQF